MNVNKKFIISILFILTMVLCLWSIVFFTDFFKTPPKQFTVIENDYWISIKDKPEVQARGKLQYKLRCYKCHGYDGEGNEKGPSLIDNDWVASKDFIFEGRPDIGKYGYAKKLLPPDLEAITIHVKKINTDYNSTK